MIYKIIDNDKAKYNLHFCVGFYDRFKVKNTQGARLYNRLLELHYL